MGFHKRGDEESSVQEENCGKTFLAHGSASVCQLEIEIATTADWEKMVRLVRYLKYRPRAKSWYKFQETPYQLETFSNTDWAGCRRTRRNTTGGYSSGMISSHQNVVQNTCAVSRSHFCSRCFCSNVCCPLRGVATSERTLAGDLRGRTRQP